MPVRHGPPPGSARVRPKRSLGQNFLVDPNLQRRIAEAAQGEAGDPMLEIGPGRGALTGHLARRGVKLWAVELDDRLAASLTARHAADPLVTVVHGDVLRLDLPALTGEWAATRVVGNIPYNITTPIVFRLLSPPCPLEIVMTVQAEVAARMLAGPGSRTYGALSVGVSLHAKAERLFKAPRRAFRPVPKVDSTVVRLTPHAPPRLSSQEAVRVRRLVRAAFSWRRKQIGTILARHPEARALGGSGAAALAVLESRGASATARPEELAPEDFTALAEALRSPDASSA